MPRSPNFSLKMMAVAGPSRLCEQAVVTRADPGVPVLYRRTVSDLRVSGEPREMTVNAFLQSGGPSRVASASGASG